MFVWRWRLAGLGWVLPALAVFPFQTQGEGPAHDELKWVTNPKLPVGFKQVEAPREDGSQARILLSASVEAGDDPKPLLVFVEGSGAQSLFYELPDGRVAQGIFSLVAQKAQARYHVAAIEKRGVVFGDMGTRGGGEGASEEYTRHATLAERAADVRLLLTNLLSDARFDPTRVLLIGHSEGSDVVAAVAGEDRRVSHVAFLSGGGAMQFFDMFLNGRRAMEEQGASAEEVEAGMESMEEDVRRILADANSETKFFQGHAYKRWATFATQAPADSLVKSEAHLFLAHGSADESVPIESFDFLVVRLLCAGRDVTVRRFPGRDHSFIPVGAEPGYEGFMEVIDEVLAWAEWD